MALSRQDNSLTTGRANQKQRTRRAIVDAAVALGQQGQSPTMTEVAEAALVSPATMYRYFPNTQALMLEVATREAQPKIDATLAALPEDPEERIDALLATVTAFQFENEALWRSVLKSILERWLAQVDVPERDRVPIRGSHRLESVEKALEPLTGVLSVAEHRRLIMATMLVCGVEAMVSARDACGMDAAEATDVMRWAARALQRQALQESATN
ncbi:MAG TPA: TetR/AcrR family transcriptional regulator [Pseudonocardia sp.]|jgi:AcrR family transcriptional regulator|nr:TetR/AcrR family transcriptional regulator [Pseudonocardia sp.]